VLPELDTERLLLRPRRLDDLDAIMRLNSDPQVMRHIASVDDLAMGRDAVAARSFDNVDRGLGYWSIFPKAEPAEFLGYVGLIPDGDAVNDVQISYRLNVPHWGKGYASESAARLLDYAFTTLGLPRIGITTHPENTASMRLAERLGFSLTSTDSRILIGDPPVPATRFWLARETWQRLRPPEA